MPNLPFDCYPPFKINDDYVFVTDDGRTYSITFEKQAFFGDKDFEYADLTYEVFLRLEKSPPSYFNDPKIGRTVTAIIQNFFDKNPLRIVFLTCDTNDGRQISRYRKFSLWFTEFQDGNYGRYDERVISPASRKEHLIMLFIRIDNPHRADVLRSYFDLTAQIRSRK